MSPPVVLSPAAVLPSADSVHSTGSSCSQALPALKLKQGDTLRLYASGVLDKVEELKFCSLPGQRFQVTLPMRAPRSSDTSWVKNILELTADEKGEVRLKIGLREGVRYYEGASEKEIHARQAEYTREELDELRASHSIDSSPIDQSLEQSEESAEISISQFGVKFSDGADAVTPEVRHFRKNNAISELLVLSHTGQRGLYHGFFSDAAAGVSSGIVQRGIEAQREEVEKEQEGAENKAIDRHEVLLQLQSEHSECSSECSSEFFSANEELSQSSEQKSLGYDKDLIPRESSLALAKVEIEITASQNSDVYDNQQEKIDNQQEKKSVAQVLFALGSP